MNEQLIKFIELCLEDGVISDKEREVIFRKSKELGVPDDECEIILEGMIQKLGKKESSYHKSDIKESVDETKLDISSKENKVDFTDFISNHKIHKGVFGQSFIMDLEKTLKSVYKWTVDDKVKESIKQVEDKIKFRFRNSFVVGEDFLVSMESGHRISLNQINDLEIKDGGVFSTRGLFLRGEHFGEFFDMNDVDGKELFLKFKDFINQSLHPKEENNDTEINHKKENKLGSINQLNSLEVTKDNSEKNEGVSTETPNNDPLISEDRIGVKTDVKVKVKGESNLTPKKKKVSNNKSKGSKTKGEGSNIEPEYLSKIYDSIYSFSGEFSSNFVKEYYKKNRSNPLLLDKTEIIRLSNKVFGCGPFDHWSTQFSKIENSTIEFGIYRKKTGVVFYPHHISFLRSKLDGHEYISLDLNSLFEMGFPNESNKTNRQIIELWMRSDGPTIFYQDRFSIKILKWYEFSSFNKWENGEGYPPLYDIKLDQDVFHLIVDYLESYLSESHVYLKEKNRIEHIKELERLKNERERLRKVKSNVTQIYKEFDIDGNGIIDVIEGSDDFMILFKKHQKKIIEVDKQYIQNFVKVSNYLKTKRKNIQDVFSFIKKTNNQSQLDENVGLLKNQIHTYEVLLFHSLNMITSIVEDDLIIFYEIYESFDKLNMFNSNWENEVSQQLENIGDGLSNLMYSINSMERNIVGGLNKLSYITQEGFSELNQSVSRELQSIGSSLKFNNLLTGIGTYQMYKINKNTKSLRE